jgi:CheY-like chemotaxis protein
MSLILVIDDIDDMRFTIRKALESAGHQVIEAPDGNKGIALYDKNDVDLVICDILMPEKEGFDTIRALVREHPAVKIIAISGGAPDIKADLLPIALRFGAVMCIPKPFSMDELLVAVDEVLSMPQSPPGVRRRTLRG